MSRLHKLTFYSKLQDLFESMSPDEIPSRIGEAIAFVEKNLDRYSTDKNDYVPEINEGILALKAAMEAFQDSLRPADGWTFNLSHPDKGYSVNLRVYYHFLQDNDDFPEKIEALADTWHVLINYDNITEFQNVQTIVSNLKYTFGSSVYSSW